MGKLGTKHEIGCLDSIEAVVPRLPQKAVQSIARKDWPMGSDPPSPA